MSKNVTATQKNKKTTLSWERIKESYFSLDSEIVKEIRKSQKIKGIDLSSFEILEKAE